jgi:hypothetical protein
MPDKSDAASKSDKNALYFYNSKRATLSTEWRLHAG